MQRILSNALVIILSFFIFLKKIVLHKNTEKVSHFVAIVLASASLCVIAWPSLIEIVKGDYGDIHASVVESTPRKLSLIVSNTGNTPIALKKIQIVTNEDRDPFKSPIIPIAEGNRIVKPNDVTMITTAEAVLGSTVIKNDLLEIETKFSNATRATTTKCTIHIEYVVPGKNSQISQREERCFNSCVGDPVSMLKSQYQAGGLGEPQRDSL